VKLLQLPLVNLTGQIPLIHTNDEAVRGMSRIIYIINKGDTLKIVPAAERGVST
jgi:hypothetical protein